MMATFMNLPAEIYMHILGSLPRESIFACISVCKALHPIALQHYYRNFTFELHNYKQIALDLAEGRDLQIGYNNVRVQFGDYVKTLTVGTFYGKQVGKARFRRVLQSVPNVTTICLGQQCNWYLEQLIQMTENKEVYLKHVYRIKPTRYFYGDYNNLYILLNEKLSDQITHLEFDQNDLTHLRKTDAVADKSVCPIAKYLSSFTRLSTLQIENGKVGFDISNIIASCHASLQELYYITYTKSFYEKLSETSPLGEMSSDTGWKTAADTKVDLRSRPSATSVTQCITDQLTTNSKNRLKKLHIRANYLTTSCVEYIAHQLPFLETLTVDIQHYRADVFSSDTCTALQLPDFLDKVNMLRAVDIRWNNINQNDTHTMYNVFNKLIAACLGTSMSYNKGIVGGIYNIKVTAKIMWGGVNFFRLRKSCNQRLIEINVYDSKYERNLLSALQNLSNINCSTIIVDVEFRTVCGLFNGDLLGAIKEVLRLCPKVRHIQFGKRYYGEQYLRASSECLEVLLHPITTSSNSFKTTALLNNNDAEDTVLPSLLHLKIVGLHVNRVFRQNNDGGKSYSLQPIINYTVPYVKYLAMIDCRLEAGEHRNAIINLQCLQHVHELILELKANFANIKDVYLIVQKQPQDVTNIVYYRCRLKRFKKNVFEKTTGDQQKRLNLRSTFSYNIWCNQIDYLRVNLQYRRTSIMSDLTLCANPIISNSGM